MLRRLTVVLIFVLACSLTAEAEFWGSFPRKKYHCPTCPWAQKISKENLIKFQTEAEAKEKGFVPCKVCNPPNCFDPGGGARSTTASR